MDIGKDMECLHINFNFMELTKYSDAILNN